MKPALLPWLAPSVVAFLPLAVRAVVGCGAVSVSGYGSVGSWATLTEFAPQLLPAVCVPLGKIPQLSVPQFPPGTPGSQNLWCGVVPNILRVDTCKALGAVPAGTASAEWGAGVWMGAGLPAAPSAGAQGGGMCT